MNMRSVLAIGNAAHGKRFCITARGHAALVPEAAEVGDLIAVIMGAQTPFVLRVTEKTSTMQDSNQSAQRSYLLVGECYEHRAMNGEMMKEAYPGKNIRLV